MTLNPQVLGQAEKAHRALFERIVTGTSITYRRWVALNLVVAADAGGIGRDPFVERLAGALKIDLATAREVVAELAAAGLVESTSPDGSQLQLTDEGREVYGQIRVRVDETIGKLYADIPADDLATAGRVLTLVTARADAVLAAR